MNSAEPSTLKSLCLNSASSIPSEKKYGNRKNSLSTFMIMLISMTILIMTAMITATIAALMIASIMALTIIEN